MGNCAGRVSRFAYGAFTVYGRPFQDLSAKVDLCNSPGAPCRSEAQLPLPLTCKAQGLEHRSGLGCSLFARHYWGNRGFFLFLGLLRCFSSPRCCSRPMYSVSSAPAEARAGFPIGDLRINGCYPLPEAYRSLPRPSSLLAPKHPPQTLSSLTATTCGFPDSPLASKAQHSTLFHFQRAKPNGLPDRGDERARTANLGLAKAALSQLSYIPTPFSA